jgi:hypothetical protein
VGLATAGFLKSHRDACAHITANVYTTISPRQTDEPSSIEVTESVGGLISWRHPRARICCCLVSSKTLVMSATELAFRPGVNVSIATGNGRFSAVDQWPVGVSAEAQEFLLTVFPMAGGTKCGSSPRPLWV